MAPVKSLAGLCIAICQRHITELSSVGNGDSLQYHHVREILLRVTNPAQLRKIELNSPHIQGETSELWLRLIKKEFPSESQEKNYAPRKPSKWYRIYERYAEERRQAQQQAEAELLARVQGLQQKKHNNVSRIVDPNIARFLPKPPKTGRTLGTRGRVGKELPSSLNFAAGSRIKITTGASVMKKARKEAKEIVGIRSNLAVPSGLIRAPRLNRAPPSMAADHRISTQPVFRPTSTSTRPPTHSTFAVSSKATYISDSSDGEGGYLSEDEGASKHNGKASSTGASISPNKSVTLSTPSMSKDSHVAPHTGSGVITSASTSHPVGLRSRRGILRNTSRPGSNITVERPQLKTEVATKIGQSSCNHKLLAQNNGTQWPPAPCASLEEIQQVRLISGNPELPRKRKAADIFMPKKKGRR